MVGRHSPRSFGNACAHGDVALARGVGDRGVGAHQPREKVLHLALARITPADAHALPGRRRIDLEPAPGRELRHRIDVGGVDPVGAAIVRHPEGPGVGDAAPADRVGGFDHDVRLPAAASRRAAAMPAAPAPTIDDIDVAASGASARALGCLARRAPTPAPPPWRRRRRGTTGGSTFHGVPDGFAFRRGLARKTRRAPQIFVRSSAWFALCDRADALPLRRRRTTMLDAAIKALSQMFSPPFRAVLLKSVGWRSS